MRLGRFSAILLLVATITVVTVVSSGVVQRRIPSTGKVFIVSLGVDVFWDPECSNQVSEVDWGVLEPGDSKNVSVYVKNTGNKALILSMNATDWAPATAETYITVTWDAEDAQLSDGGVLKVSITLSVSAGVSGITDFQFSIVITGGEA
jgi:hypothetical protein